MLIILVKQSYSGINHEQDDDRENVCCLYYALEGLAVVVNCVTCFVFIPGSIIYVHACHLVVPYLLLGLQDVQWAVGNSRGVRKLARIPHVNQKKKKKMVIVIIDYKF
jgi:hypothetical protein